MTRIATTFSGCNFGLRLPRSLVTSALSVTVLCVIGTGSAHAQLSGRENMPGGIERSPSTTPPPPGAAAPMPAPPPPPPVVGAPATRGITVPAKDAAADTVETKPDGKAGATQPAKKQRRYKRRAPSRTRSFRYDQPPAGAPKTSVPPAAPGPVVPGNERRPGGIERSAPSSGPVQ